MSPIEYVAHSPQNVPAICAGIEVSHWGFFNFCKIQQKAFFFSLKMSKKRDVRSDKETLELLAAWGAEEIQKKLQGVHKNTDIYKKVSEMMKKKGIHRDWTQCRTKFKHLKSTYKNHKDNLSRSGAGRSKSPKFFDIMDSFLADRPEAEWLESSIDTSGDAIPSVSDLSKGGRLIIYAY
jgi:phosphoribosylaminoimidazole carboxylase/phosphoribosylaminoimidazole-succinocarboxamide synthase